MNSYEAVSKNVSVERGRGPLPDPPASTTSPARHRRGGAYGRKERATSDEERDITTAFIRR
jgi:hypothetical protein